MLASFAVSLRWSSGRWRAWRRRSVSIEQTLLHWIASGDFVARPHVSGRSAVVGHDPGHHRHRLAHPHLLDCIHARRAQTPSTRATSRISTCLPRSCWCSCSAPNFLVLFVGWEGVGLCSYLLIGFWFEKKSASDAGKKAFVVNRIGDYAFILGTLLVFVRCSARSISSASPGGRAARDPKRCSATLSVATLLLFIGATGKSAQIPLYVWLPDAMEGPTPVSALIHAATMVTAGVYMIGRNAVLFNHAPETMADRRGRSARRRR